MSKCVSHGKAWIKDAEDCLECKKEDINYWKECKKLSDILDKEANLTDKEVEEYIKQKRKQQ